MEALSSSSLVSVGKQAFFTGDKVVMRDSDKKDSFTVTTLQEYRSKIGCEPTALSNYILNEETIKSAELVSRSEGHVYLSLRDRPRKRHFPLCGEDDEFRGTQSGARVRKLHDGADVRRRLESHLFKSGR